MAATAAIPYFVIDPSKAVMLRKPGAKSNQTGAGIRDGQTPGREN
jgi:hypothetical protein